MTATKKVVINACFGGFRLSAKALALLAELQGRTAYFYVLESPTDIRRYRPATIAEADEAFIFLAYDIPDAHETLLGPTRDDDWHSLSQEERQARNAATRAHRIDDEIPRDDPLLVRVVETLGEKAGKNPTADLKVVEIPADVEFSIHEYDGNEHIAEVHRTWS